jgi:mRNA-degrading endonuclease RelE of RelBE toxin-antitoxin system
LPHYRIQFSIEALEHIRLLTARQRTSILDKIEKQLSHEPRVETRNRKLMRQNTLAVWELRAGDLRVYYDVQDKPEIVVIVRAVGVKDHEIVRIAGKEFKL